MKSLYITSVERYSGKTATCLALGRRFQRDGFNVGYLKPLSLQPWRVSGMVADEDAAFVKETLGLRAEPWELSPVVVSPELLNDYLLGQSGDDFMGRIKRAYDLASEGQDVLLLEGGGSLREGYTLGLPTPEVASAFGSNALAVVKYRDQVRLLDDALAAQSRLGDILDGVIINRVPEEAAQFVAGLAVPFLEERGIAVFGALPEARELEALSLSELVEVLDAEVLSSQYDPEALVENFTVGAMTGEAALRVFRKQTNKAVITGGDRTDIQLAALETSTICLILTGNLTPSPLIVKEADEFGVAILLVRSNTIQTVEAIERVFGKTRLGQPVKLQQFEQLFESNVDLGRLYRSLGLR
jgi:BioD-like phosphotransacetylase family protein